MVAALLERLRTTSLGDFEQTGPKSKGTLSSICLLPARKIQKYLSKKPKKQNTSQQPLQYRASQQGQHIKLPSDFSVLSSSTPFPSLVLSFLPLPSITPPSLLSFLFPSLSSLSNHFHLCPPRPTPQPLPASLFALYFLFLNISPPRNGNKISGLNPRETFSQCQAP